MELGKPQTAKLELEIQMLEIYRVELNDYCRAINHQLAGSGLSAQQVIGLLLKIDKKAKNRNLLNLPIDNISSWNAEKIRLAEEWADRIQARVKDIGAPADLVFYGSKLVLVLPHDKGTILQRMETALLSISELLVLLNGIQEKTGFPMPTHAAELPALESLLKVAAESPDLKGLKVSDLAWQTKAEDIKELIATGEELARLYRTYKDTFVAEAWSQDILDL
jgi:hypothetical protein